MRLRSRIYGDDEGRWRWYRATFLVLAVLLFFAPPWNFLVANFFDWSWFLGDYALLWYCALTVWDGDRYFRRRKERFAAFVRGGSSLLPG